MTSNQGSLELAGTEGLARLAARAEGEHQSALSSAKTAVAHAICAGEALLEARQIVTPGNWAAWVESQTSMSEWTAKVYMRVAAYRDELPANGVEAMTLTQAAQYLRGRPTPYLRLNAVPEDVRDQVRRMHSEGVPTRQIARKVGYARSAVQRWISPDASKRHVERAKRRKLEKDLREAAEKALQEKEDRRKRDAAARRAGGDIAEVYSLLRKLTAAVDRAAAGSVDQDDARTLRAANHQLFRVEDDVVRILGVDN